MNTTPPTVFTITEGPLGNMLLAASPRGLCGLWFVTGQRNTPGHAAWSRDPAHPVLAAASTQLADYFAGRLRAFDLPLDLSAGTPFQQSAWRTLLTLPWGDTITYGELARRMGRPEASRAAGVAIGRNPVSIIVPCHRVVGANGSLTGYAGGLERKTALLRLEAQPA